MKLYCTMLRIASMLLNLLCNTVVPVAEKLALKFRIGNCDCPGMIPSPDIELRGKVKRGKARKCESNGKSRRKNGNEVKRMKLLVDVIVRQNETEEDEVEVREIARFVDVPKTEGIFVKMFNIPSSVVLFCTSKLRRWAHDLDNFENKSCNVCENNRIKKSPKRRISRANYRKIIPFFPFNLLGFSNYSAFQMPTLTHCGKSQDEMNNLNVSKSERCKRRRCSSTEGDSDSENDFSHLDVPEDEAVLNNEQGAGGYDEVDSEESAETVTKRISSSPSSNGVSNKEGSPSKSRDSDDKVVKGFLEELDEAANEDYNSEDDPDYQQPEHLDTSSSSYVTDSVSEESFLSSSRQEEENATAHESITSAVEASTRRKRKSVSSLPIVSPHNGHSGHNQNGHQNEDHNQAFCEDDYKTPEESEHEAFPSKQ